MARRILVPFDGSLHARCALVEAAARAERDGADVTLLAVAPETTLELRLPPELRDRVRADTERRLHALLGEVRAELPAATRVEMLVRSGDPAMTILATIAAGAYDLVFMGARSHGHFHSPADGSTARAVRTASAVPVVVTPAIPWRERRWTARHTPRRFRRRVAPAASASPQIPAHAG